jgi:hypothetical protein
MFETTKLAPVYNGYQYLFIFIIAIIIDAIVHFFSSRKYNAVVNKIPNTFGFAPELMLYYRSLCRKGPFSIEGGPDTFYSGCNSWLLGALIAGTIAVFMLLVTDLTLQAIDYRNSIS